MYVIGKIVQRSLKIKKKKIAIEEKMRLEHIKVSL